MDIEYLQTLWQKEEGVSRYALDEQALRRLVQQEGRKFEKRFRFRDWYELGGGVFLGGFFIFIAVFILPQDEGGTWIDQWHWILLGFACFFIAFLFVRLRLAARAFIQRDGDSLIDALEKRRDAIVHQITVTGRAFWWYVVPISLPLAIVVVRAFKPEAQVPYTIVCALTFAAIVLGNRWYARRKLQPQLDSVNKLIEETNAS